MAAPMIDQLRELMVQAGGNAQTVRELEPDQAVAHNALDSFGFTAFIAAIEERFAIRVSDKSSVKLRSLNDFAQYVETQLERPAGAGTRAASSGAAEASDFTLDGAPLHYEIAGSGPPLLLLNGIGLDLSAWGPLVQALCGERQLVLLETRGSGLSGPPPEPCTTARLAADALALLDHLSLGSVDVLGFSLGGLVAQELALLAPDRIRSLVLAATAARLPGRTRRALDAWRRLLLAGVEADAFRREQFAWVFGACDPRERRADRGGPVDPRRRARPLGARLRRASRRLPGPRHPRAGIAHRRPGARPRRRGRRPPPCSRSRDARRAPAPGAVRAPPRRPRLPVGEHARRGGVGAAIPGLGPRGNERMNPQRENKRISKSDNGTSREALKGELLRWPERTTVSGVFVKGPRLNF